MKIERRWPTEEDFKKSTCVDMHTHSGYSYDCITKVRSMLKLAQKKGFGLSITDHNTIKGSLAAHKLKFRDVLLIPGIEVTIKEHPHIMVYTHTFGQLKDLDRFLKKFKTKTDYKFDVSVEELSDFCRSQGFFVSAAHPYSLGKLGIMFLNPNKKLLKKIKGFEVFNGYNFKDNNEKAKKIAKENNLFLTAGTDGHFLFRLGQAVNCVEKADNAEDFLDQIKKRKNFIIGHESPFPTQVLCAVGKEFSMLTKPGRFGIIKRQLSSL